MGGGVDKQIRLFSSQWGVVKSERTETAGTEATSPLSRHHLRRICHHLDTSGGHHCPHRTQDRHQSSGSIRLVYSLFLLSNFDTIFMRGGGLFSCLRSQMTEQFRPIALVRRFYSLNSVCTASKSKLAETNFRASFSLQLVQISNIFFVLFFNFEKIGIPLSNINFSNAIRSNTIWKVIFLLILQSFILNFDDQNSIA